MAASLRPVVKDAFVEVGAEMYSEGASEVAVLEEEAEVEVDEQHYMDRQGSDELQVGGDLSRLLLPSHSATLPRSQLVTFLRSHIVAWSRRDTLYPDRFADIHTDLRLLPVRAEMDTERLLECPVLEVDAEIEDW